MENSECSWTSDYVVCVTDDLDLYAEIVLSEVADDCVKDCVFQSHDDIIEIPIEEAAEQAHSPSPELQSGLQMLKEENVELNLEYDKNASEGGCRSGRKTHLGSVIKKLRDRKNEEKCRNFCASTYEMESFQELEDENLELSLEYGENTSEEIENTSEEEIENISEEESDIEDDIGKLKVWKQDGKTEDSVGIVCSSELHQTFMHDHSYAKSIDKSDNLASEVGSSVSSTDFIVMTVNVLNQNLNEHLFPVHFDSKWRTYSPYGKNRKENSLYSSNCEQIKLPISKFFPFYSRFSDKHEENFKFQFHEEAKSERLLQLNCQHEDKANYKCRSSSLSKTENTLPWFLKNKEESNLPLSQNNTLGLENLNLNYKDFLFCKKLQTNLFRSSKRSDSLTSKCAKTSKPKENLHKIKTNERIDYFHNLNNSAETLKDLQKLSLEDISENSGFVLANLPTFIGDNCKDGCLIPEDVLINDVVKYDKTLKETNTSSDDTLGLSFRSDSESDSEKGYSLISNEASSGNTEKYSNSKNCNLGVKPSDSHLIPSYYRFCCTDSVNAKGFNMNFEPLSKYSDHAAKEMNVFQMWTQNLSNPSLKAFSPDFNPTFVEPWNSMTDSESDDYCSYSELEESIICSKFHDTSTPCKISNAKISELKLEDSKGLMNHQNSSSSKSSDSIWDYLTSSKSDDKVIFTKSISEISSVISRTENFPENSESRKSS